MESPRKNQGFTLLELLMVIGIIAVLSMLVMGATAYVTRVAREKRVTMSCTVLETAIQAYHAEYNEWPGGEPENPDKTTATFTSNNHEVFGPLRVTSSENENGVAFFDESAFMSYKNGRVVPLSEVGTGNFPLVYITKNGKMKSGGSPFYYHVKIDYAIGSVSVSAPSLTAGDLEDD